MYKKRMKKRPLTALLITVLLLTILTGSALAEAIETGNAYGMARFTITPEPVNVSDPKLIQENQLKVNMGSSTGTYAKDYEYTITMPAGTQEATVSYEMINSDSTVTQNPNGFFFEFAGDTLNYPSDIMTRSAPSSLKTSTTISLNDGVGVTPRILSYCYSNSGMTAGNYSVLILNGKDMTASYRFRFVTESFPAEFSENLTEHTAYDVGAEKVQPLQVTVSSPDGSSVTYAWFRGSTAESVNEQIENADGSSYTPDVSKVGVTYYRVKATVTTPEGKSGVITSNTAKIAVKDPKVTFSLRSFWGKEIEVVSKEENIYRLTIDKANFGKITGKLTGTIPDDVTIKEIWSGSEADCYDAEKIRAQEPDYDTNTFSLDLNKVVSEADDAWWALTSPAIPPQSHRLGRCLYLKDSNDTVYTLILDSDYQLSAQSAPSMVQLIDANGKSLPDFQVTDLQSDTTSSSVHTGTIQSDTPVVLRAQTYGGGVNLTGELVRDKGSSAGGWNEAQTSWVLVNGEMIGGKCYGGTGTHPAESAAFTLKQGLNVVEVYTNTDPFAFSASRASQTPGLSNSAVGDVLGTSYTYIPVQRTSCVVYLIDYQGTSASNVPQENMQDTTLSDVVALRYGALGDRFETCPLVLQEDGAYLLTLPASFKTEAADSRNYTHCVLINAKPKTPGASAVISSSAKLGESIANTAFLNAETLGDSSFTITVTAADGTTTKDYTVNVNYLSSETKPGIVVEGVKLDNAYNDNTYTYYLEFANASSASGTMTVTVPEGATATVNGTAYTAPVKLDPKEDFYRVTITAADGLNTSSYYFVTKYDDGTTPYTNISDLSKKLAEEMLSGWYDTLENDNKFANYWKIFMTKATGGRDGKEYDFNGAYVKDPARHGMSQATDWAACIMEIVMMGRNPYSFPRYVDGELVENFNYVEGLIKQGGGAWGNNVWYHMASKATGARQIMLGAMKSSSLDKMSNLDIRGWSIASLAGCVETKDMVRYIDSLHNVQDTDGKFTSLWTDQSWHGGSSGNTYTIGCVLSAIASAGTDPDRLFAVDGHTPLETIKETLYLENGRFYEGGLPDGDLPKDMIIGLGDILHGSNVWARYALTEQKYNDLKAKAEALNAQGASITIPGDYVEQDVACGRAYYDLYDDVYDALVKAGRTTEAKEMRPDVIWGMPYEVFADEVNKMPAASKLTANDLAKLKELIAQYEAMDDSSRKAVASDVLAKYQALVKKGLELKHDTTSTKQASSTYQDILDLPTPDKVTEDNKDATKTKVEAIRKDIEAMTNNEKQLLSWAGASVLGKLEAVEKELEDPSEKITVTFTLLGDHVHTETETDVHTLKDGNLTTWIATDTYQVNPDTTVWDFIQPILEKKGITWETSGNGDSVYVKSLTYEGKRIGEFTNGNLSGWKYTVNGKYPDVSVAAKKLSADDVVIFHYTDDYTVDDVKGGDKPDPTPSGDKYTDQQISNAYTATGNALALKNPSTGSVGGEWLMLGLARADHVISSSSKDAYLSSVRSYINENYKNGKLSNDKSTENSRIVLALTALGEDPQTFVADKNLLKGYSDFDWTVQQGVTGPIFALLAIDSQKYTVPDYANIRNDLMKEILDEQKNNGGWSADGKTVDVDMTAMAIQALAPYYKKNNTDVVEAVNAALVYLVSQQNEATGAFPNANNELSAESTAQVIVALTSLGKNPATEKRFQAGDKGLSPIDGLMRFYQENGKFSHKLDAAANDMATEQSYYALVSYYRLKNGKTSLYDMTDLKDTTPETVASVIEKINDIGPVTENSYEDIIAAEEAYNKLSNADKAQLPKEYLDILNNAKQEYAALLANKKTDAKKELNDYYLGLDQKDYGEAGRKKLSEILAKAQRDITSAKSCPQVESILRQAISDLDAVRKGDITVSFRLIGSLEATQDVNLTTDSYLPEYVTWIPTTKYELASNATVYDLFTEALRDAGLSAIGAEGGYVKTIYAPSCLGGYALSEFSNGKRSGWMYTLNGKHSSNALTDQKLEDGDMVVWHYVNDYSHEVSDWSGDSQHPSLGNGTYYNGWLRAADISPERYVEQLLGKILTVGAHGTVEPKLTLAHLGKSVTFTFKPDNGYHVADVKVDGKSVGAITSYTVDKLSVSTRIEVTFTNGKLPFTDVRESDWFYDDVVFAYENGLFAGTSDTTFSPNSSMTRAMLVTVLYRLEGQPTVNGRSGFSDVTFNSYYEDAVTWAANNGIVNGTSTSTFSPNANVTREQMAAILYRYAQYKKYNTSASSSLNSFSDHASVSGYAVTPLQWAVAEKLVNGSAGKLMPTGNATRAQVAAILHRFVTNVAK